MKKIITICLLIPNFAVCGVVTNRSSEQFFTSGFQWLPEYNAFRVGDPNIFHEIGQWSNSFGKNNRAAGMYSQSWGAFNDANGICSTAWGMLNKALGADSTVWGYNNKARGDYSTVGGWDTVAGNNATSSFVYGREFDFNEPYAFAIGFNAYDDPRTSADFVVKRNDIDCRDSNVRTTGIFKTSDSNSNQWYAAYIHSQNTTTNVHPQYVLNANLVFLAGSTQQDVIIGCLVDSADGKTPVTAFADLNDVKCYIYKNDTSETQITLTSSNFAHIRNGYWKLTLTADHTDTLGYLLITFRSDDAILPYSERLLIK